MSAQKSGAQDEALFIVFDYHGSLEVAPLFRRWGLLVEDGGCVVKRGVMGGLQRASKDMVAYLTPNPDGTQRVHVDLNVASDLVGRLSNESDFEVQPAESIFEDDDSISGEITESGSSLDRTHVEGDQTVELGDQKAPAIRESWDDNPDNEETIDEDGLKLKD